MSAAAPHPSKPPAASTGAKPYRIVGQPVEVNRFDNLLQRVVSGYEVQAQWLANGTVVTVFAPEGQPLAETVDQLVRVKGAELDTLTAFTG